MVKSKKHYKNKFNSFNMAKFLPFLILFVVISLTIGYSTFQASFDISEIAVIVKAQEEISITGLSVSRLSSQATSSYEEYDSNTISSSISLPSSDSKVTYNVTITNLGNTEMAVTNITGLPNSLNYSLEGYTLDRILCDDGDNTICNLGSVTTFQITIGYSENGYDGDNTNFILDFDLVFSVVQKVAKIGNNYYDTLQGAVTSINNSNQTKIVLLKNTIEVIQVTKGQNIVFDLGNLSISNDGNKPVIEVSSGSVTMVDGVIKTSASQGAINVHSGCTFNINGGKIIATGVRQGIYNNGGTVNIGGTAYIHNTTNQRAAVHNVTASGTITITGGTIIAESYSGILNAAGTLTIGVEGGGVNATTPVIQGGIYGVNNSTGSNTPVSTDFNYYDGKIKGKTRAIYDEEHVIKETGYGILHGTELINNFAYDTGRLAFVSKITFDANEGTVGETSRTVEIGTTIGILPIPIREDYVFDGWFTSASGGTEISSDTVVTSEMGDFDLFAHWIYKNDVYVARINNTEYHTLASAISSIGSNAETTITLIRNTIENVTIASNRNIVLNLQSYVLSSPGDNAVIVNKGRCQITSGTVLTNSGRTAAINNDPTGNLMITGGSILATGQRQAIYNDGGVVTIMGNAYLEATTSVRATVQNHNSGGSVVITGGTIVSPNFSAVYNEAGTLIVGEKDGNINTTKPIFEGSIYGINNEATFKFYDGIVKGITGAITGTIADKEQNSTLVNIMQVQGDVTYNVAYLE